MCVLSNITPVPSASVTNKPVFEAHQKLLQWRRLPELSVQVWLKEKSTANKSLCAPPRCLFISLTLCAFQLVEGAHCIPLCCRCFMPPLTTTDGLLFTCRFCTKWTMR
ncbi:hypothetical protein ATANTOWER_029220 [Ataeniobius toweri]|uniref:Uncharacterized protein n=1 Tax=Ataeniobius toweri TaxID=208326 RepID=A0ABU7ALK5_9TELE|nr:hypothetical protein [Ataeniobius toweri]